MFSMPNKLIGPESNNTIAKVLHHTITWVNQKEEFQWGERNQTICVCGNNIFLN
jgi:hypothetical protein